LPTTVDNAEFARAVRDWATLMTPSPGTHPPLLQPLSVGDIQVVFKFLGDKKVQEAKHIAVSAFAGIEGKQSSSGVAGALAPAPAPASEPGSLDVGLGLGPGLGLCMHPEFSSFPSLVGFACTEEAPVFDSDMWKFVRDHVLNYGCN
jgi:hypothetical protein